MFSRTPLESKFSMLGAVALMAALATITIYAQQKTARVALLLNPGEASGEYKDPDDPWDSSYSPCRGLPTCSDSTSSPIIRSRENQRSLSSSAVGRAETMEHRADRVIREARGAMMTMATATSVAASQDQPLSPAWGHGMDVNNWDAWMKDWAAYKKSPEYLAAQQASVPAASEAAGKVFGAAVEAVGPFAGYPTFSTQDAGIAAEMAARVPGSVAAPVVVTAAVPPPEEAAVAAAMPAAAAGGAVVEVIGEAPLAAAAAISPKEYFGLPRYAVRDPRFAAAEADRLRPQPRAPAAAAPAASLSPGAVAVEAPAAAAATGGGAGDSGDLAARLAAAAAAADEGAVVPTGYVPWYQATDHDVRFDE